MPTQTATGEWIQRPSGLYVSAERMQSGDRMFSLQDAAKMDAAAFNQEAKRYGVHIDEEDFPLKRLVKYSIFLSRRDDKKRSAMFDNPEYVAMATETAAAKEKGQEPLASLYDTLADPTPIFDAVREILAFRERIATGADGGKFIAERFVFNDEAELVSMGDIRVAPQGWTRVLGMSGYPRETSGSKCLIENIDYPVITADAATGFWFVSEDPVGEERIVIRGPGWGDGGILSAGVGGDSSCSLGHVGALRSRRN